jgi:SPP1 gp7 family putative phage head morphogenesis protein
MKPEATSRAHSLLKAVHARAVLSIRVLERAVRKLERRARASTVAPAVAIPTPAVAVEAQASADPAPRFPRGLRTLVVNAGRRRRDPTKTALLRKQFENELVRRFRALKAKIVEQIVDLDGFGLAPPPAGLQSHRKAFDFPRSAEKRAAFMRWLRQAERQGILEISEGVPITKAASTAWTNVYVESAYQKGIADAGAKLRQSGAKVGNSWVSGAFNRPIHADRIGQLYTRAFSDLDNITDAMDVQISRVLAQGLLEGRGPREIARALADRVEAIGITRARVMARTEVIAAHADATLNAYDEAGVAGVDVEAEWSTTGDDRVCPECQALEGRVFSIDEARNMLPAHPNCRCAWRPKVISGANGLTLMWRRPRNDRNSHHRAQHLHAQRRSGSPGAVRRPHAHSRAGGADRRGRP